MGWAPEQQSNKREMSEQNPVRTAIAEEAESTAASNVHGEVNVWVCTDVYVQVHVCVWRKRASHHVPDQEHDMNIWDLDTCVYRDSWN